jgi:putative membrane protein
MSFMKRIVIFGLLLVVALLGLTFALMNADTVRLNFYITELEAPLSLVVVLAVILGAALGVLASLGMVVAQKRELGRLRRSVKLAEAEVSNLRALPLKDNH